MTLHDYLHRLNTRFRAGISTEHSYRGDLQSLLEDLIPDVLITNEPTRIKCGAPDFIITRKSIPIGYIEAKDLGADLSSISYKEQFDRYKASLPNLIITNYLDFELYINGERVSRTSLGTVNGDRITASESQYSFYISLIRDFASWVGQTITSSRQLAEMMASKARLLASIIDNALVSDEQNEANSSLKEQLGAFKNILIHDITHKEFADIYAQTIAYGMFAARLHDSTLHDFTRFEAANLIPKTNPFLRRLFQYIAGYDLDERIAWVVDALADIFRATDVVVLLQNFGSATQQNDPFIHFYETFLAEYDPALRKARGVWYTPEPVVDFIVRAVDDILKSEFSLPGGLANNSKTKIKIQSVNKKTSDTRSKLTVVEREVQVHKVQILDPACGTGTFLSQIIKRVYTNFHNQRGVWSSYVENDLIPRVNGFELLMASYAMAHLKLDLLLNETGFQPTRDQRFRVFLTNSLEEYHPDTGTLFASWLSDEANHANRIKRDIPVMVVIGNPPYSVSSSNKGGWITNLVEVYKEGLTENNISPLSDDYIKFLRFSQYLMEKNKQGIVAMITNNSFIDGLVHRHVRRSLMSSFDKLFILDLHGNAKKREVAPDGSKDENVFDIQQGVSINLFIRTSVDIEKPAEVYHQGIYGLREHKYKELNKSSLQTVEWTQVAPVAPFYFFVPKNFSLMEDYNEGFALNEMFKVQGAGVQSKRDKLFIEFERQGLEHRIERLLAGRFNIMEMNTYNIKDSSSYRLLDKIRRVKYSAGNIRVYNYRVFDDRFIYYDENLLGRPFFNVMRHMMSSNLGLVICSQQSSFDFQHCFVTRLLTDHNSISLQTKEFSTILPLFSYSEVLGTWEAEPNLDITLVQRLAHAAHTEYEPVRVHQEYITPLDVLNYIYAILHSPMYREMFKEFLKIGFPRIPYPRDGQNFWDLVKLGEELRTIHLLENPVVERFITSYQVAGDNRVESLDFDAATDASSGKVWINERQYFDRVPEVAWNFYIGGYQPAQKWLKDRKGRTLTYDDIMHYQKIIVALVRTNEIMQQIDDVYSV